MVSKFFHEITPSPRTSNASEIGMVSGTLRKVFTVWVTSSPMIPSRPRVMACLRCPFSYRRTSVRPSIFHESSTSRSAANRIRSSTDFVFAAESMGFVCRTSVNVSSVSPATCCVGELDRITLLCSSSAIRSSIRRSYSRSLIIGASCL